MDIPDAGLLVFDVVSHWCESDLESFGKDACMWLLERSGPTILTMQETDSPVGEFRNELFGSTGAILKQRGLCVAEVIPSFENIPVKPPFGCAIASSPGWVFHPRGSSSSFDVDLPLHASDIAQQAAYTTECARHEDRRDSSSSMISIA